MTVKRIRVHAIDCHRNGICGAPFHVVIFDEGKHPDPEDRGRKVGIVFEQPNHCVVLDIAMLAAGDIEFGSNSWRGDQYEPHLRKAVRKHQASV
jgi:hypothetical protein